MAMMKPETRQKIVFSWKEAVYFDLWSIVHFLSGVVLGALLYCLGQPFSLAAWVILIAGLLWEVFEIKSNIVECKANRLTDLIFMFLGLSSVYLLFPFFRLDPIYSWTYFVLFSVIFISLCLIGWKNYKKRQ